MPTSDLDEEIRRHVEEEQRQKALTEVTIRDKGVPEFESQAQLDIRSKTETEIVSDIPQENSQPVVVPFLVGLNPGQAKAKLLELGLDAFEYAVSVPGGQANQVVATTPQAGATVQGGHTVTLMVEKPEKEEQDNEDDEDENDEEENDDEDDDEDKDKEEDEDDRNEPQKQEQTAGPKGENATEEVDEGDKAAEAVKQSGGDPRAMLAGVVDQYTGLGGKIGTILWLIWGILTLIASIPFIFTGLVPGLILNLMLISPKAVYRITEIILDFFGIGEFLHAADEIGLDKVNIHIKQWQKALIICLDTLLLMIPIAALTIIPIAVCNTGGFSGAALYVVRKVSQVAGYSDFCQPFVIANFGSGGGASGGGGASSSTPSGPNPEEDQAARAELAAAGITVNKADCTDPTQTNCTSLDNTLASTINEIIAVTKACDISLGGTGTTNKCGVIVTGGSEAGHADNSGGTCSHGSGQKMDVSAAPALTTYIEANFTNLGGRTGSSGGAQFGDPSITSSFVLESSPAHWDISVGCIG